MFYMNELFSCENFQRSGDDLFSLLDGAVLWFGLAPGCSSAHWSGLTLASGGAGPAHITACHGGAACDTSLGPARRFGAVLGFLAVVSISILGK